LTVIASAGRSFSARAAASVSMARGSRPPVASDDSVRQSQRQCRVFLIDGTARRQQTRQVVGED
jgi:hypothetical protein